MCYIVELDKIKLTYKLSVGYLIFIFVYTLTILILSIVANQDLKSLPLIYTDITNNWSIDPIYQIALANATGCGSGYEYFSLLQNEQTSYTYWSHQNNVFRLCYMRLTGYNFLSKYPIYPLCQSNEQICGGIYVQNKYCAPIGQCPINSILLVNQTGLQNVDFNKYSYTINITSNLFLLTSTLAESLPISQIQVFGSQACLDNQYSNYDQIYSQALCTNDNRWKLVDQITQQEYQTANSFTSNINNVIGLYTRSYIQMQQNCRQQNLVEWANRLVLDQQNLKNTQIMLVVLSALNFGIVGFLFNLYYFLQINYKASYNKNAKITMTVIKQLIQWFHSILIILAFGFSMDIKLFLQIVQQTSCSDQLTQSIFTTTLNSIWDTWEINTIIFFIFIFYFIVECTSFSIYLDQFLKQRKTVFEEPQSLSGMASESVVQNYIIPYYDAPQQRAQYVSEMPAKQRPAIEFEQKL